MSKGRRKRPGVLRPGKDRSTKRRPRTSDGRRHKLVIRHIEPKPKKREGK
jgi:hypothetical protein